ncbi:hypothetical protein CDD83_1385 [Cordyceps sp. RAO-2017]|nr:hypothetical protein CDD83_1385 [Cordyceps sp. RAO-2017]
MRRSPGASGVCRERLAALLAVGRRAGRVAILHLPGGRSPAPVFAASARGGEGGRGVERRRLERGTKPPRPILLGRRRRLDGERGRGRKDKPPKPFGREPRPGLANLLPSGIASSLHHAFARLSTHLRTPYPAPPRRRLGKAERFGRARRGTGGGGARGSEGKGKGKGKGPGRGGGRAAKEENTGAASQGSKAPPGEARRGEARQGEARRGTCAARTNPPWRMVAPTDLCR